MNIEKKLAFFVIFLIISLLFLFIFDFEKLEEKNTKNPIVNHKSYCINTWKFIEIDSLSVIYNENGKKMKCDGTENFILNID